LSEKILFGEIMAGQIIRVDAQGEGILGEFTFEGIDRDSVVGEPITVDPVPAAATVDKGASGSTTPDDASELDS
jgi:ATP-dependent Clp protease ATP-binding subunit ClpC